MEGCTLSFRPRPEVVPLPLLPGSHHLDTVHIASCRWDREMQSHCVPRWTTNRCLPPRGAGQAGAAPSEAVLLRAEFASDSVGCWVPGGSQQSMGDILDKGSRDSLGVTCDRSGLKTWLTTAGGMTLSQGSPPAPLTGCLREM